MQSFLPLLFRFDAVLLYACDLFFHSSECYFWAPVLCLQLPIKAVKKKEELEEEFLEKIQKLQAEKFHLQELIGVHQRNEANIEMEKQSAERSAGALEKENAVLIMTLEKVCLIFVVA